MKFLKKILKIFSIPKTHNHSNGCCHHNHKETVVIPVNKNNE